MSRARTEAERQQRSDRRRSLNAGLLTEIRISVGPFEKVEGVHGANKLYRITGGLHPGALFRVRTNLAYGLQMVATGTDWDAPIEPLENVDFLAVACINSADQFEFYFLPARRADADMKHAHQARIERMVGGSPTNNEQRVIKFDEFQDYPWHGFARKWAEFKLAPSAERAEPAVASSFPSASDDPDIRRLWEAVAARLNVPVGRVHISVELVPGRDRPPRKLG